MTAMGANMKPPHQRLRARERNWRAFLAIGLLLPALAAIIGIVAWAISIEVANGVSGSHSGGGGGLAGGKQAASSAGALTSQRKFQSNLISNQYQQNQAHSSSPQHAHQRRQQSARRNQPPQPHQLPLQQQPQAPIGNGSPTLVLTNVEQVEALTQRDAWRPKDEPATSTSTSTTSTTTTTTTTTPPPAPTTSSSSTTTTTTTEAPQETGESDALRAGAASAETGEESSSDAPSAPTSTTASGESGDGLVMNSASSDSGAAPSEQLDQSATGDDDSANFEAIASAISSTLSSASSSPKPPTAAAAKSPGSRWSRRRLVSGLPVASSLLSGSALEGDTGASTSAEAPPRKNYNYYGVLDSLDSLRRFEAGRKSAAPQVGRRRTTGEHVADVINHIVEQRRRSGSAQLTQAAGEHVQGPQIVVVAPVGGSSDLMKARSLTREVASAEKGAAKTKKQDEGAKRTKSVEKKHQEEPKRESAKKPRRTNAEGKLIGARLLGSDSAAASQPAVRYSERVEVIEDDDSSALLMKSPDADQSSERQVETKRESQVLLSRHLDSDEAGENPSELSSVHVASQPGEPRSRSPRHEASSALHFERYAPLADSRQRPSPGSEQHQAAPARLYSAEQLIREHVMKSKAKSGRQSQQQQQQQQQQASPAQQVDSVVALASEQPSGEGEKLASGEATHHQVKVMPTTVRPARPASAAESTSAPATSTSASAGEWPARPEQPAASGPQAYAPSVQSVQVPLFFQPVPSRPTHQAQQSQQQQHAYNRQQSPAYEPSAPQVAMESQQTPVQYSFPQPPFPHQHQQHQYQSSQLPVFADQEFNVPAHMVESVIQNIQRSPPAQFAGFPAAPTQRYQHPMAAAASHQEMVLVPASWRSGGQSSAASEMLSRLIAHGNQQHQHQHRRQAQVLADRNGVEQPQPISVSVKGPAGARGLVAPVAQMALKHLFSSLGGQPEGAGAEDPQSRSAASPQRPAEQVAAAGSAPQPSALLPEPAARNPRYLALEGAHSPPQPADQEAQDSYGPPPSYHMGGGAGYGPAYSVGPEYGAGQQQHHYPEPNEKKSKGITFNFGGGPIGGGTQLITSPMGIFKHLMIPLLPNPKVNLNGKIVFGVVLEKTASMEPPKKKHKFWGRR